VTVGPSTTNKPPRWLGNRSSIKTAKSPRRPARQAPTAYCAWALPTSRRFANVV
jgi:hypothetical protein